MVEQSGLSERRSAQRAYARGRASVAVGHQLSFQADMIDVSEAGVCLTAPMAIEPGTLCRLEIDVEQPRRHFTLTGRVCFCVSDREHYRVGFHCPDLSWS
jgi:PilZ domain-containing protein